jgi:predicted NAD-dependent protein-ADP-ribosyltransferase YbiA (DUF1768 family)
MFLVQFQKVQLKVAGVAWPTTDILFQFQKVQLKVRSSSQGERNIIYVSIPEWFN